MTNQLIGTPIKALRQARGLSQNELARLFGFKDRQTVSAIAPATNRALMECMPDALRRFGSTVDEVWRTLLPGPRVRFVWQDSAAGVTVTPALRERYGALFDS